MIEAKELRIGNLINCHFQTTNFNSMVEGISVSNGIKFIQVYCGENLEGYSEQNCEAIPLTPKILKQCNCKQGNDKEMWRHPSGVWLTKVHNKNKFFIHGFRAGHTIAFLHQYQNAIFVLTGEEMIIEI